MVYDTVYYTVYKKIQLQYNGKNINRWYNKIKKTTNEKS